MVMKLKSISLLILIFLSSFITGQSLKAEKAKDEFRDFEHNAPAHVQEFYRLNHCYQTLDFVLGKKAEYSPLNKKNLSIWEAFEVLDTLVDESDPDISVPQVYHAFQTAEALRNDNQPEWLVLTGFIHDLGKMLTLFNEPQWAVVGDTFPVGCAYEQAIVFPNFFIFNSDNSHEIYTSKYGIYSPQCGLQNLHMSWGHDEYLYIVMNEYLPKEALYIIRFHSFYAYHTHGAYHYLMDDYDKEMLPWLQLFSSYDLYSKSNTEVDFNALIPYYKGLVDRYFPQKIAW